MAISRGEREGGADVPFRDLLDAARLDIHTALPGIIQSFDPEAMTCSVQPAIRGAIVATSGKAQSVDLPMLVDCPVVFPGGGGYALTFPLEPGDECLVIFAERCIDAWWQSGGVQSAAEYRLHDLSDGFVIPGVRSQPHVVTGGVGSSGAELRTDDGDTILRIDGGEVTIIAPDGVTFDTPTLTVTGDVVSGGISYLEHTHTCPDGETTTPH